MRSAEEWAEDSRWMYTSRKEEVIRAIQADALDAALECCPEPDCDTCDRIRALSPSPDAGSKP